MVELERVARQEPGLGGMSRETVRRMLKKTISSRGAS
jgi:putative transposase